MGPAGDAPVYRDAMPPVGDRTRPTADPVAGPGADPAGPGRDRVAELEQQNRRLRARVRRLERRANARERTDLGFLFVMTYGRSGSTLLQGILNALPGYLIRGENHNMLRSLHDFHSRGVANAARQRRGPAHPWYGAQGFPVEESLEEIRALVVRTVLRPGPDTRVTGFKEIRWRGADLPDYVAFLRSVFPGARFVVNTRDLASVSQSRWWAEDEQAPEKLERYEAGILEVAATLGDAAYRVHYDDYVADPEVLRGLFAWLGEPWDAELVRRTMAVRHSY